MRSHPRTLTALLLACCLPLAVHATEPPPAAPAPRESPDAKIERTVIEDDGARIEESRNRGQTEKVVVKPKDSKAPAYEIVMGDASRDHSADAVANRGSVGKRVWRLFEF